MEQTRSGAHRAGHRGCDIATEINYAHATSTPSVIPTVFQLNRTRADIVNAIESDAPNLQRQCRRHQGFALQEDGVVVTTTHLIAVRGVGW